LEESLAGSEAHAAFGAAELDLKAGAGVEFDAGAVGERDRLTLGGSGGDGLGNGRGAGELESERDGGRGGEGGDGEQLERPAAAVSGGRRIAMRPAPTRAGSCSSRSAENWQ